jgi:DNA-binding NarL/FixJ family response regulator
MSPAAAAGDHHPDPAWPPVLMAEAARHHARMTTDQRPRVLLADDHDLVRLGLRRLLEEDGGYVVVGEATAGAQLPSLLRQHDPDALVLDLQLRDGSALDRIPELVSDFPRLAVLVLSMHDQRVYARRCLRLGARGYLMKEDAAASVIDALGNILSGRPPAGADRDTGDGAPPIAELSDRELQVFELVGDGCPTRIIAARLGLSEKTVEAHKASARRRLGLAHGSELARLAMSWRETCGR